MDYLFILKAFQLKMWGRYPIPFVVSLTKIKIFCLKHISNYITHTCTILSDNFNIGCGKKNPPLLKNSTYLQSKIVRSNLF